MYSIGSHGPTSKVIKYLQPMLVGTVVWFQNSTFVAQTQSWCVYFWPWSQFATLFPWWCALCRFRLVFCQFDFILIQILGLGREFLPKRDHINDDRNPPYLFFSLMIGEHLGLSFFEMTEEKLEISFISGLKNTHHRAIIRKKTPV